MAVHRIEVAHRLFAFVGLVLLATLSLILGTTLHWYWGDVVVSLIIASVKAYVVLFFFMELGEQPLRSRVAIVVAVTLVLLFVGFTAMDVATRQAMPRGPSPEPSQAFYQR
jgi:cytochrome c oxidase subunit 4